jgi:large subunit ribosomal protein L22
MGSRKQNTAELRKEAKKSTYVAKLRNSPTSPRKMNLVAELIRGKGVYDALNILHFSNKHAAKKMGKLLRSAIANFEQKSGERAEDAELFVSEVRVDGAPILKRFRPAPQGRAYRIRKRSNHILLAIASAKAPVTEAVEGQEEEEILEEPQVEEAEVVEEPETEEVEASAEPETEEVETEAEEGEESAEEEQEEVKAPKAKKSFGLFKKGKKEKTEEKNEEEAPEESEETKPE